MPERALPFVSVILPVFNDAERLAICLRSLRWAFPKISSGRDTAETPGEVPAM